MALAFNGGSVTNTTGISAALWTGATKTISAPETSSTDATFLLFKMTQTGGASTPSASLSVEVSPDGSRWYRFGINGAITDADETVQGVQRIEGLFRYVRPVLVMGGGTLPTVDLDLQIESTASITVS